MGIQPAKMIQIGDYLSYFISNSLISWFKQNSKTLQFNTNSHGDVFSWIKYEFRAMVSSQIFLLPLKSLLERKHQHKSKDPLCWYQLSERSGRLSGCMKVYMVLTAETLKLPLWRTKWMICYVIVELGVRFIFYISFDWTWAILNKNFL